MTRKHFEAIALTLKTSGASEAVCEALAFDFKAFNPLFDANRFMMACGY